MFGFSRRQQTTLHLTWFAFFLTFVAWFNMAPFNTTLIKTLGFTQAQIDLLMICNLALAIPARIFIGGLSDYYGPRIVFSGLLVYAALVCVAFGLSQTFEQVLATRLLMGIVGGGFVVGTKMISDHFPDNRMGLAQGIYAGWGNFGAAAAAFSLPAIAWAFPEETGWRVASFILGGVCLLSAVAYWHYAEDTNGLLKGHLSFNGFAIEVGSRRDFILQALTLSAILGGMVLIVYKLTYAEYPLLSPRGGWIASAVLFGLYAWNIRSIYNLNKGRFSNGGGEYDYAFSQALILSLVYALTFGAGLAIISIFPEFLQITFGLSVVAAGIFGSTHSVLNLISRPGGGWISDQWGRRKTLIGVVFGAFVSLLVMSQISSEWSLIASVMVGMLAGLFLQAGNGACFAIVPRVRKELTGKLAGLVGAYGNLGGIIFLTVYSLTDTEGLFLSMAGFALAVLVSLFFLKSEERLSADKALAETVQH
ncbi:MAG: MFS transporter [Candidatus Nitrohelix vancouverensis]|uniref:MFS transporter n=1 Tax=Candidatus Nitrohelix vancouverensis TaxID=2705534 RepID=A0A7T0C170_9BACT|nr:MAG: MFS transporter [Candidatus Nitrohelix vancouverensis]